LTGGRDCQLHRATVAHPATTPQAVAHSRHVVL
jgi:hypothetical protein